MPERTTGVRPAPHSHDAEQAVLGAMLTDKKGVALAGSVLADGKHFYSSNHQTIFDICMTLFKFGDPIDITTVANELERHGKLEECGGRTYISELAGGIATSANVQFYAKIVREKSALRGMIQRSNDVIVRCYRQEDTIQEIIDVAMGGILETSSTVNRSGFIRMAEHYSAVIEELDQIASGTRKSGIPTGYPELDSKLGGFQPTLIVVAGRPGMGKTAFMLCAASNIASDGKCVGFLSLEMGKDEAVIRNLCTLGCVDSMHFREGKPTDEDWKRVSDATAKSKDWEFYLDDQPDFDINAIASKIWAGVHGYSMNIVFVDHLQKIKGGKSHKRNEQISEYTGLLFRLTRELGIPIVLASQLGRQVEERRDKRPRASDLKESGDIEQDAKQIIGLFRPEVYAKEADQKIGRFIGQAEAIVLKNTGGPTGIVELIFRKEFTRFESIAQMDAF